MKKRIKKIKLPPSYKEVSRVKTGNYWTCIAYSKKLGIFAFKDDGISDYPVSFYDLTY